ncbi:MAG: hypothetical protein L3J47_11560 [Sulfurovum sp.]|nr:hypothetical protein [Sulfurovum sp.]
MFKYVLKPKEGYSIPSIILFGADITNSTISIVDRRTGVEVGEIPATDFALDILNPEMPKVKIEYADRSGTLKWIAMTWVENFFYAGSNPFDQIIVRIVESAKVTEDDVVDKIIKEYRLCSDTTSNRRYLKERIKVLRDIGVLNLKYGFLEKGLATLPKSEDIKIPIESGYNPIMKRIYDVVEMMGSASIWELEQHLVAQLRWVTPSEFKSYIDLMIKQGYLKKINENEVTVERPLEPY